MLAVFVSCQVQEALTLATSLSLHGKLPLKSILQALSCCSFYCVKADLAPGNAEVKRIELKTRVPATDSNLGAGHSEGLMSLLDLDRILAR